MRNIPRRLQLLAVASIATFALVSGALADPAEPTADPAPADPAATPAAPPAEPQTEEPYTVRLRKLEQHVEELKEAAWRIKARVGMLKEAVIAGGVGSRSTIIHENKMGGNFRLIRLVYQLDGATLYSKVDESGKLNDQKKIEILTGPIAPGSHRLQVLMVYRGHGYGVFSYLKGYKFTKSGAHTFVVGDGKHVELTVQGYERGGISTPMEKRPDIKFKVNTVFEAGGADAAKK